MSNYGRINSRDLDNYITGHGGEDQFTEEDYIAERPEREPDFTCEHLEQLAQLQSARVDRSAKKVEPVCLLQVNSGSWCQETYETASRHAARRAKTLRAAGYRVSVASMGMQVTGLGLLKLTLVDIAPGRNADTCDLPPVKVERIV